MKNSIKRIIPLIIAIAVAVALFCTVFVFDPFKLNLSLFKHELQIDKTANVISQIKKISEFTTACYYEELVLQKDRYEKFKKKVYNSDSSNKNLDNVKESTNSAWNKLKGSTDKAVNDVKGKEETTTKGKLLSLANAAKDIVVASGSAVAEVASSSATELLDLAKKDDVVIDSTKTGTFVWIVKTRVRAGYDLSKIEEGDLTVKGDTLSIKLPEVEIFDIIVNPSDWEPFYHEGEWTDEEIRNEQSKAKEFIRQDAINFGLLEKAETFGKASLTSLFKTFGFEEVVVI